MLSIMIERDLSVKRIRYTASEWKMIRDQESLGTYQTPNILFYAQIPYNPWYYVYKKGKSNEWALIL